MKTIHVDVPNAEGETECYERKGGFFLAVKALYAIWRYGAGKITVGNFEDDEA